MSTTRFASPKAPATDPGLGRTGLLLCCHGVYGGPGAAAQHAASIQRLSLFAETRVCCLKGRPALANVVRRMSSAQIFLVPLLMAEGYTARQLLGHALEQLPDDKQRITLCRPVGVNPRMADVLSAAAMRSCRAHGWAPQETTVFIMGHGTTRCADSGGTVLGHAEALARQGRFAAVAPAFLDQPPSLSAALSRSTTTHAVVVGLFADRGAHGENDVPCLLAKTGHSAVYAGPVGTAPELSSIILDQVLAGRAEAA